MTRAEKLLVWAAAFGGLALLLMGFSAPFWAVAPVVAVLWVFLIKSMLVSNGRSNRVY